MDETKNVEMEFRPEAAPAKQVTGMLKTIPIRGRSSEAEVTRPIPKPAAPQPARQAPRPRAPAEDTWKRRSISLPEGNAGPVVYAALSREPWCAPFRGLGGKAPLQQLDVCFPASAMQLKDCDLSDSKAVYLVTAYLDQALRALTWLHERELTAGGLNEGNILVEADGRILLTTACEPEEWPPLDGPARVQRDLGRLGKAVRNVLVADRGGSLVQAQRPDLAPMVTQYVDWLCGAMPDSHPTDLGTARQTLDSLRTGTRSRLPWSPPELHPEHAAAELFAVKKSYENHARKERKSGLWILTGLALLGGLAFFLPDGKNLLPGILTTQEATAAVTPEEPKAAAAFPAPSDTPVPVPVPVPASAPVHASALAPAPPLLELLEVRRMQSTQVSALLRLPAPPPPPPTPPSPVPQPLIPVAEIVARVAQAEPSQPLTKAEAEVWQKAFESPATPAEKFPDHATRGTGSSPATLFPEIGTSLLTETPPGERWRFPATAIEPGDFYVTMFTQEAVLTGEEGVLLQRSILSWAKFCGVKILTWTILPNAVGLCVRVPPGGALSYETVARELRELPPETHAGDLRNRALDALEKHGPDEMMKVLKPWRELTGQLAGFLILLRNTPLVPEKVSTPSALWGAGPHRLSVLRTQAELQAAAVAVERAAVVAKYVARPAQWMLSSYGVSLRGYLRGLEGLTVVMEAEADYRSAAGSTMDDLLLQVLRSYGILIGDLSKTAALTTANGRITGLPLAPGEARPQLRSNSVTSRPGRETIHSKPPRDQPPTPTPIPRNATDPRSKARY